MSNIAAGTTSGTALVSTGNTTGQLVLQTNGTTTAVTIGTDQVVTLAQPLPVASGGTGGSATPTAGGIVYGTGTVQAVTAAGTSGQLLQSNAASAPTWVTFSAGLTLGTPVNTTSGTAVTFTGIPSGVRLIIISFSTVSTNGSSPLRIQIGDSGGIETTSYTTRSASFSGSVGCTLTAANSTEGFDEANGGTFASRLGNVTLTLLNSSTNRWVACSQLLSGDDEPRDIGGAKALSDVLTQLKITTVNGTDAFDSGSVNIAYI